MHERYLTAKEIGQRLNCSISTLYRWMDSGIFAQPIKLGKMSRWKEQDLREFLDNAEMRRGERGPRPKGVRRGPRGAKQH